MKKISILLIIINIVLLIVHTNFTFVSGYGGPGVELVWKPFHGISPHYGGGEELKFKQLNSLPNPPWYIDPSKYKRIKYFDDGDGPMAAERTMFLLSFLTFLMVSFVNLMKIIFKLYKLSKRQNKNHNK